MLQFGIAIFLPLLLSVANVQPWTIDLPEVRQYYFAKYGHVPPRNEPSKVPLKEGEFIYNNFYSNSPHNDGNPGYIGPLGHHPHGDHDDDDESHEEVMKGGQYAEDYEYQSYMEKKVNHVVAAGARYLEGLRRSVEQYTRRLENCTTTNFTTLVSSGTYESCKEATQKSEHVRRIAQLALYTTRLLQEKAYDKDHHEDPREEKALLLRLASFLDTLTQLTGFEPDPREYLANTAAAPSPAPTAPSLPTIPLTEDQKRQLMACMANQANSPEPATERCKVPLPKAIMDFYNITDVGSSPVPSTSDVESTSSGNKPSSNPASANPRQRRSLLNPAATSKTTKDLQLDPKPGLISTMRSVSNREAISKILQGKKKFPTIDRDHLTIKNSQGTVSKIVTRLAPDHNKGQVPDDDIRLETTSSGDQNPLENFVNYYAKYKAWSNENPGLESGHLKVDFHDENHLQRSVRSVEVEKKHQQAENAPRVPEDPMQDLSAFIRHRSESYLNPDKEQAQRVKTYIHDLAGQAKLRIKRSYIESRPYKPYRSFGYYRPYRARVPEDPYQDISYYLKFKEGTEIRRNPVQAAQVRLGLEQIYQTGDIRVVQRYGSNYNPAVPDQVVAGLLRSAADA